MLNKRLCKLLRDENGDKPFVMFHDLTKCLQLSAALGEFIHKDRYLGEFIHKNRYLGKFTHKDRNLDEFIHKDRYLGEFIHIYI